MLAVSSQGCLGLAVELHQRHAGATRATQGAAGTAPLTEQQTVRDTTEVAQALDPFVHQGDAGIAADFADTCVAVRIDVKKCVEACLARDAALHQATPWADYMAAYPTLLQRVPKGA